MWKFLYWPNWAVGPLTVSGCPARVHNNITLTTSSQQHQSPSMSSIHAPPPGSRSIEQILEFARSRLVRLTPELLLSEYLSSSRPIHVIDIRPAAQRESEGPFLTGAVNYHALHQVHIVERNVLEWRLDPQCEARLPGVIDAEGYQTRIVVICSEGYTSSLAAASLQDLGLSSATDLVGGQKAWKQFRALIGKLP